MDPGCDTKAIRKNKENTKYEIIVGLLEIDSLRSLFHCLFIGNMHNVALIYSRDL